MCWIIYKAENIITKEIYIGKTKKSLKNRISAHKYEAFKRQHKNKFHSAIREFGLKNFKFEKLKEINKNCTLINVKKIEKEYICKHNSVNLGYNTQYR